MANKRKKSPVAGQDPYAGREARKYENPIPSREFILDVMGQHGAPLTFEELVATLEIAEPEKVEALGFRLRAMARDGQIIRNRKGGFCPVNKEDLVAGRIIAHPDGFGFLKPDEGGDDLFLTPREMRSLWHDDRAVVRVSGMDRRGRREGQLVEILERAHHQMVGRIHLEQHVGFLRPDNKRLVHDVIIPDENLNGAAGGQMVVAEIVEHPTAWRQAIGRVTEVLGDHMAPGMETDVAIRNYDIPVDWPEALLAEIASLTEEVPDAAKEDRVDLRDLPLVTIDGADARDFDDAVYCERKPKGWRLLVAIADVSAYVKPGTALDDEAYKRGNSVYFPDRVVPMLPEVLSNGLCSLNPHVDRLCMVAELYIADDGKLSRSRFFEAVMRSQARLTYDQVGAMLMEGDAELCSRHAGLLPHLHELYSLYKVLHGARAVRGAIDFDTTETRFRFDENGKIAAVVPLVRHDAHRLIEECMLAANVAAARQLLRRKMPAMYRIHEPPSAEKLADLHQFLGELGLRLKGGLEPTAKDYADLLERVQDRADAHMIQTVLLRSMMQAVYSADNVGHFGLAFPAYTHFTSPIRRYPDLMVHRALKHLLVEADTDTFEWSHAHLVVMGEHCSMTERRADEATRDSSDALKCEFMLDKVGERYGGIIAGVNSFGLFVELDEIFITGLVHVTALDYDYFHFDPIGHRLTGERSGKSYRLGDAIEVTVAAVNMDDRKIDLMLPNVEPRPSSGKRRSGRRSGGGGGKPDNRADKGKSGEKGKKPLRAEAPGAKSKSGKKTKPSARKKEAASGKNATGQRGGGGKRRRG